MNELEALRAYFDAHTAMQAAIDADKFAAAYVKANQARDRLIQIEQSKDGATCGTCHAAPLSGRSFCPDCRDEWTDY